MRNHMRSAAMTVGVLGASVVLAACGGAAESTSADAPSPASSPTSETSVEAPESETATSSESEAVTDPTPDPTTPEETAAPEDSFEGDVIDLGTVDVSVGDRVGVPVPNDLIFNGDPAAWDFQLDLGTLLEQTDLERDDVGETVRVADPSTEESTLIYDVVATGEGALRISFTNPNTGEATMLVVSVSSK